MEEQLNSTSVESEVFMESASIVLNRFSLDQNNKLVANAKGNDAKCEWHCM